MSNTNDDTNMTGNADNCDPLRTKSGQGEHGEWTTFPCGTRTRIDAIDSDGLIRLTVVAPVPVTRIEAEIDIGRDIAQSAADHIAEQTGKPAQPLSELAKLINSWDEYLITVEREIAERVKSGGAGSGFCDPQVPAPPMPDERPTPSPQQEPAPDLTYPLECQIEKQHELIDKLERQLAEVINQRDAAHQKCREYRLVALGAEDALEKMTAQRDEAKAEMWKARNALKRVAGALRYITNDFRAFKHYARTKNNLDGSYGIYSIDRAKRALADVRKLIATWGKGGEA